MAGFSVQEPFFSKLLGSTVSTYLSALKDPALPLMEMQVREGGREGGRREGGSSLMSRPSCALTVHVP